MSVCYVIGAGVLGDEVPDPQAGDFVIAGDGGYRHCQDKGIHADLVVGDFDSLGYIPDHPHVLRLKAEKDETDMMIAVSEGMKRGYREFFIYGGTGGRISHTIANIQLMMDMADKGVSATLVGTCCRMMILKDGEMKFGSEHKGMLSIFCCGDRAEGVTEEGLKYSLDHVVLHKENPVGVSNEFLGIPSRVEVEKGTLLIVLEGEW